MPLICKPLAKGQKVPEMLEVMLMGGKRPCVAYSPKQVSLMYVCR